MLVVSLSGPNAECVDGAALTKFSPFSSAGLSAYPDGWHLRGSSGGIAGGAEGTHSLCDVLT